MKTDLNIGELIENEVRKQQIPIIEFAKMIHCQRSNVYNIFHRNKIDIIQLKQISKVLNRNFFKDLAENLELITISDETENEKMQHSAVSQFFNVVPDLLIKLGKEPTIVFSRFNESKYKQTPDFGLSNDFITFTIGETLKERIGICPSLQIAPVYYNNYMVEVCQNITTGLFCVNIKLDYKSPEEWLQYLKFAFETYSRFKI